ncbi:MAG TPA: M48 family metalloprotease, partial [Candidatus Binatia bacterium]|nr:M48 family metalloprotease [Candidatus Binatia bacterium]
MERKLALKTLSLLLGAALLYSCVSELVPATGEKHYLGYTWQQEIELGKQASKEVSALFGVYRDAKLERYVSDVGNRVLATSHLRRPGADEQVRNTPVTFGVLDSPIINAMALPGGYVYVTRGMLAHLTSEDQLATVLAHEVGHIAARHAARQAWQQQIGQGLLMGGALITQGLGLPGQEILNLGGMAAQLIFRRYSREDELEADKLGVEYGSGAGYDSREVIAFFQTLDRIQEKEGQGMPSFLSTHPNPGDRIARIQQLTAAQRRDRRTGVDARYFDAIEGLVVGEDPRQGFVEANVFYHPDLRFRFPVPRGFKVVNQPTQVIMVEGQNRAILGFTSSGEKSLQSATNKFLNQPGLKLLERGSMRSNGFPAFAAVADAQAKSGQVIRLMIYFVEYRGAVYHFIGYTSPQAFGSFRSVFLQSMQGFGEIHDTRILNRQPVRLALEPVRRAAPVRDVIPKNLPAPFTAQEVAILNQVDLNQDLAPGRTLKIPAVR